MANIINLTPHEVSIIAEDGSVKATFPSSGIARAEQHAELVGDLNGIELVTMKFGDPIDLPAPEEGTFLVVSIITANAAKACGRSVDDLIITADPVRNDAGQIIGCRRFALV